MINLELNPRNKYTVLLQAIAFCSFLNAGVNLCEMI